MESGKLFCWAALVLLAVVLGSYWALAQGPDEAASSAGSQVVLPKLTPEEIASLIEQLGSDRWAPREEAHQKLIKIGEPALASLRKAISDEDPERSGRARQVISQIEENLIPDETIRAKVADLRSSGDRSKQAREWLSQHLRRAAIFLLEEMVKGPALRSMRGSVVVVLDGSASKLRELFFQAWREDVVPDQLKTRFIEQTVRIQWGAYDVYQSGDGRTMVLEVYGFDNAITGLANSLCLPWDFLTATWKAEMDGLVLGQGETMGSDGVVLTLPADALPGKHTFKATARFSCGTWSHTLTATAEVTVLAVPPNTGTAPANRPTSGDTATLPALKPTTHISSITKPASHKSFSKITGRVVDERGMPVADIMVSAKSYAMGRTLRWAFTPRTNTNDKGEFELPVPFDDILYDVVAGEVGVDWLSLMERTIPARGRPLELLLNRPRHSLSGTLLGPNGKGVPDVPVLLVGDSGFRCCDRTDQDGHYRLANLGFAFRNSALVVKSAGQAVPLQIVKCGQADIELDLALAKEAELTGVISNQGDGQPIAGATVQLLLPNYGTVSCLEATTDEDGHYRLTGIPSGDYRVIAVADEYFLKPPDGSLGQLPKVTLVAGQTARADVKMERAAFLRGNVIDRQGNPVPGALVAAPSGWVGKREKRYKCMMADGDGKFSLPTDHLDQALELTAFSDAHGLASVKIPPLESGQVADGCVLQLTGSARVQGTVTNLHGRPIKDITCRIDQYSTIRCSTGIDGGFDLGRVALTKPDEDVTVAFYAPRVFNGAKHVDSYDYRRLEALDPQNPRTFYLHQSLVQRLKPDNLYDFTVRLKPTPLVTISGAIADSTGKPVGGTRVEVFRGGADVIDWEKYHASRSQVQLSGHPAIGIGEARTDEMGNWTFHTVREDGACLSARNLTIDWDRYAVGIEVIKADGVSKLFVPDIAVPKDNNRVYLPITIDVGRNEGDR